LKKYNSLKQIQQDLYNSSISCEELVESYLKNISKNKQLNAFIETYDNEAKQIAKQIDVKIKNKTAGPLAGLVIGIKDNICYKNHYSSASSKILQGFQSTYSATVVDRLLSADAIILGRLNCDEFAMGSSNENSIHGPVKNPTNNSCVPGGSSGGSAAAVRANLCHASLGTDTGGSIRQPAAFCGVVGLKPTYGLVSRYGLMAFASSFDQIGPITKSIADTLAIMEIISGKDDFDSTCNGENIKKQKTKNKKQKIKFGVIKQAIEFPEMNKGIKKEFMLFLETLKTQGHQIKYIDLPLLDYLTPAYYIMTTAEASSNLSRYDGIKYGYQHNANDLDTLISKTRTLGFGKEVKRRIMLGTFVLSSGYYEAYYQKAQKVRRLIKQQTEAILKENNYILLPTTPNVPFKIGEKLNLIKRYYEDIFTVQANLSGHPAISFPLGEDESYASAQLIGDYFSESEMLQTAMSFSKNK
tara:strand:+ start:2715 stop:4124 length:1410 start_codon:yes stop_codon:yes gene_type:complete